MQRTEAQQRVLETTPIERYESRLVRASHQDTITYWEAVNAYTAKLDSETTK